MSVQGYAPDSAFAAAGPAAVADAELVAAARQDPRAFERIYARYLTPVYRFVRARVGSVQDAEDVTSAVFIEALTGLAGYEEQGRFVGWLFTIAHRQVMAYYRRAPRLVDVETAELAAPPRPGFGDEGDLLERALLRLTEDRRAALALRFYGGLKVAEVADVLGKGESATKMLIHRGLLQLRELLGEDPRG
jgi:RNA polymerase sigma factor (sigma-70 family)